MTAAEKMAQALLFAKERILALNPRATTFGIDEALAVYEAEKASQMATPTWDMLQEITDSREVDECIRALLDDQTNDNAVFLVRAVIKAVDAKRRTK